MEQTREMSYKFGSYYFQAMSGYEVTLKYNKWINENLDVIQDTIISVNYNTTITEFDTYENGMTINKKMLFTILLTYKKWVNEEEKRILSKEILEDEL